MAEVAGFIAEFGYKRSAVFIQSDHVVPGILDCMNKRRMCQRCGKRPWEVKCPEVMGRFEVVERKVCDQCARRIMKEDRGFYT